MTNDSGGIFQNVSGGNMYGGIQAIMQGDNNQPRMETHTIASDEKQLNQEDVIRMLAQIEQLVTETPELPEATKNKSLKYLEAAKEEVKEPEPNKEVTSGNLKGVAQTLKTASESAESLKMLWETTQPIFFKLASWLCTPLF